MNAASSMHTGGINAALGDGSVQFISDTVNAVTTGTLDDTVRPVTGGISPFGVWGAYGSMNGGETNSL
jgi:prepilin-type processing-associated H-X9-DG protein